LGQQHVKKRPQGAISFNIHDFITNVLPGPRQYQS
jgi:hypothetical protein